MFVIGIDPAPVKPAAAFDGLEFHVIQAQDLRGWVDDRLGASADTLIAWDAPLAFDPMHSFYTRPVDRDLALRARDEPSINTAHFANLSHWAITCHTLGYPFGNPPCGLLLVDAMPLVVGGPLAIEVHPAFALYHWWRSSGPPEPVPPYKRGGRQVRLDAVDKLLDRVGGELRGCAVLRDALRNGLAPADDLLDAAVAYEVGSRFVEGSTVTVGGMTAGFIVLPKE